MSGVNIRIKRDRRFRESAKAISQRLHERLKTLWRRCVRAFIEEAIQYIHVDTGMSVASLYNTATKVQIGKIVFENAMGRRKRGPSLRYDGQAGVKKSIQLGQRLGKDTGKILFGSPHSPILVFRFDIVVFQYKLHEYGLDGWNSLEKGKLAFLKTWDEEYPKLINKIEIYKWLIGSK